MSINKVFVGMLVAVVSIGAVASANAQTYTFTRSLYQGVSRGTDVMNLQKALNMCADTQVSMSGAGAPNMETSTFGPATKAAVMKWQTKVGVNSIGIFGPASRAAYLVKGNACGTTTPGNLPAGCTSTTGFSPLTGQSCSTGVVTQTGPITAAVSATNPVSSVVIAEQATADLAHFTFNGTGTVTTVTLQRVGVSADTTLKNVYLFDGATRLTDAASVSTGGVITFNSPTGLFMVNGMKTVSVKADIDANTAGQTVGVRLNSFATAAGVVNANLSGNIHSVASNAGLATVTMTGTNSVGTSSVDAGTSNFTIWGNSVQVNTRSVWLRGANFKVIGSAQGALSNVRLVVDGAQVGMATTPDMSGNVSFDLSSMPLALNTGSHTVELRADVVAGSDRSFYVSMQNASDLMAMDSQFMVNLTLAGHTAARYNSGTVSIGKGTLSLSKDAAFSTSNALTSGASNAVLAKYTLKSFGEAVKVMQMEVTINDDQNDGLRNVGIYVNGAQVGSSQNVAATGGVDTLTFNLGSSLIVAAGQTSNVEVRADLQDASGANYAGAITTGISIPASQAQGQSSYSLNVGAYTPGTFAITAGTASAVLAENIAVLDQSAAGNTSNVKIGSFTLKAGNTEGLRVTNLSVGWTGAALLATTGAIETTDISNLKVSVNGGAPSNAVNPQATNNFSVDFTIPAGMTQVIDVWADITSATDGETITTNLTPTARGAVSNISVAIAAVDGQTMTVGTGAVTSAAIVTSNATSAQYVIGSTTTAPIIRYNFKSTGGPATITKFNFAIGGTTGAITSVAVKQAGSATTCVASVSAGVAEVTNCSILVPQGFGGVDVEVLPVYGMVGFGGLTAGATGTVDLSSIEWTAGTNGSSTVSLLDGTALPDLANLAASSTMTLTATLPNVTLSNVGQQVLTNGEVRVGSVTVSALSGGNINLETLGFAISASGGALIDTDNAGNVIILKEGNNTVTTTDNVAGADSATVANGVVTFTNDTVVTAGGSRTFDVYVIFNTVTGDNDSALISLVPASFVWDDINGNGNDLAGTLVYNFPTTSITIND